MYQQGAYKKSPSDFCLLILCSPSSGLDLMTLFWGGYGQSDGMSLPRLGYKEIVAPLLAYSLSDLFCGKPAFIVLKSPCGQELMILSNSQRKLQSVIELERVSPSRPALKWLKLQLTPWWQTCERPQARNCQWSLVQILNQ